MKPRLLAMGIVLALTGCTNSGISLVPADKQGQGSTVPLGQETTTGGLSEKSGVGMNTLGIVSVDVKSLAFDDWPNTMAAQIESFGDVGLWKFHEVSKPVPAEARSIRYFRQQSETSYESLVTPQLATHVQYRDHGEGDLSGIAATIGGSQASKVLWDSYLNKIVCYVPKAASGALELNATEEGLILSQNGISGPVTSQSFTLHTGSGYPNNTQYSLLKIATMSVSFSVSELDGTQVSGLTPDFILVNVGRNEYNSGGIGLQRSSIKMTETASGSYELEATVYGSKYSVGTALVTLQVLNKPAVASARFLRM